MKRIHDSLIALSVLLLFVTSCGKENSHAGEGGTAEPPKECTWHFTKGADLSWITEMEADGKKFRDADGKEKDCFILMKELGFDAVRLRVWVSPSESLYGASYCDKSDVVAKAVRADKAGMKLMIDFHYSDFFADPGRQEMPVNWKDMDYGQLKDAVAAHTKDVLEALDAKGVIPEWIQIGNETRNGMMWPWGQLWDDGNNKGAKGWSSYVGLYNAGYDAAKSVFPEAEVMPHLNHAYEDNIWWIDEFCRNGGKLDMIAFSHYPEVDNPGTSWSSLNAAAVSSIRALAAKYDLDVVIAEIGVKNNNQQAKQIMEDFFSKADAVDCIKGIFYWEPECDGVWKPACYTVLGWKAYDMGAFAVDGKPGPALEVFR